MKETTKSYCQQADGNCVNPAGYAIGTACGSNDDPPRCSVQCSQCYKIVCPRCRRKVKGEWLCNDCLQKIGYIWNSSIGRMEKPCKKH